MPTAIVGAALPGARESTSGTTTRESFSREQGTLLPTATKAERLEAAGFRQLGAQQQAALQGGLQQFTGGASPFSMTAEEAAAFGAPYEAALARMRLEGREFADQLAGGRGLRLSDTPISQQALQRFGLGLAELEAQRAQNQLQFGLLGNQFKLNSLLGLTSALPAARQFSLGRALQQRLAQPSMFSSGRGTRITKGYNTGSPFQGMQQGLNMDQQIGDMLLPTQKIGQVLGGVGSGMAGAGAMGFSDQRLKRDIAPVRWKWHDGDKEYFGVLAQDLQRSHPHLVSTNADGHLIVDYGTMVAMLLDERETLYHQLETQVA